MTIGLKAKEELAAVEERRLEGKKQDRGTNPNQEERKSSVCS
jgi:hypothetical protein